MITKDSIKNHVSSSEIAAVLKQIDPVLQEIKSSIKNQEHSSFGAFLPFDKSTYSAVKKLVTEKNKLKAELVVVIGIGGSNLGTQAIDFALRHQVSGTPELLYADTVDPVGMNAIIAKIAPILKKGKKVILNAISKSGSTTETAANFDVLVSVLQKHAKDWREQIVVTTDRDSPFWNLAVQEKWSTLEIPKQVGGRYSVFSAVGLFPLWLAGYNIDDILKGAQEAVNNGLLATTANEAAILASFILEYRKKGVRVHDNFFFYPVLEYVGKWYRQLLAESLGKKLDLKGKIVHEGILPTVSIGSTDLHSMAQLYLGGPKERITTFVTVKDFQKITVPQADYVALVQKIRGKDFAKILSAISDGVKAAYSKNKLPFIEMELDACTERQLGYYMQTHMLAVAYLGKLLGVNPFDQPSVEDYKVETKKILSS